MKHSIRFSMKDYQYEAIKGYAEQRGLSPSALVSFATFNYIMRNSPKYKKMLISGEDKKSIY